MKQDSDAFNQLPEVDQKAAVDISVALLVIGLRITTIDQTMYDFVATEFCRSRTLSPNVVKYALRALAKRIYMQDWTLMIQKIGDEVTSTFTPSKSAGSNDETEHPVA
jgi:hypothetical protein